MYCGTEWSNTKQISRKAVQVAHINMEEATRFSFTMCSMCALVLVKEKLTVAGMVQVLVSCNFCDKLR